MRIFIRITLLTFWIAAHYKLTEDTMWIYWGTVIIDCFIVLALSH